MKAFLIVLILAISSIRASDAMCNVGRSFYKRACTGKTPPAFCAGLKSNLDRDCKGSNAAPANKPAHNPNHPNATKAEQAEEDASIKATCGRKQKIYDVKCVGKWADKKRCAGQKTWLDKNCGKRRLGASWNRPNATKAEQAKEDASLKSRCLRKIKLLDANCHDGGAWGKKRCGGLDNWVTEHCEDFGRRRLHHDGGFHKQGDGDHHDNHAGGFHKQGDGDHHDGGFHKQGDGDHHDGGFQKQGDRRIEARSALGHGQRKPDSISPLGKPKRRIEARSALGHGQRKPDSRSALGHGQRRP